MTNASKSYDHIPTDIASATTVHDADLGRHTAGGQIRFRTGAKTIAVKVNKSASILLTEGFRKGEAF